MKKTFLLLLFSMLIVTTLFSQTKMTDYEQSYYITFSGTHPQFILEKGNNWEIVYAFKEAGKLSRLNTLGIQYTPKQIEVLCALNFLKVENNTYQSQITIVDNNDAKEIRTITKEIAAKISMQIKNNVAGMRNALSKQGFENNSYTVLFSYIMDNKVWKMLESNKILKPHKTTVETPIWDGTIWFTSAKRDFACGTNSTIEQNLTFAVNWTDSLELSFTDFKDNAILKEIRENDKIQDSILRNSLLPYGICNEAGMLTIPYISKSKTPEVYELSSNITNSIYNYLVNEVDFNNLCKRFNIKTKGDAIIIIYHDIMWDILDTLAAEKIIKKPNAFENKKTATAKDMKDLLLIYEQ